MRDFGADSDVGLLEAERVGGWFTFTWGGKSAQTFNVRLAARGVRVLTQAGVAGR